MSEAPQPGDPFCGDDPHFAVDYGLPPNPFDPSPILPTCPPMPYGALGPTLAVRPASVGEAAQLLQTAGQGLHQVAAAGATALEGCLARLGVLAEPSRQGFDDALAATRRLGDDVSALAGALAAVLQAYAVLDGDPQASGRAV